jgi:PRC-barrel domain
LQDYVTYTEYCKTKGTGHALGQTVYNDKDEQVGKVDGVIIAPNKAVSYAIVGAGGFLNVGKHDVRHPSQSVQARRGQAGSWGASKDALKAMPAFEYAN